MKEKMLKRIELHANSPRKAFYILILERVSTGYQVRKESGGNGRVLHRAAWSRKTREEAEQLLERIVQRKTNPCKKSGRIYRVTWPPVLLKGIPECRQTHLFS